MRLYYIGPAIEATTAPSAAGSITRAAIEPIADLIFGYFRADGIAAILGLSGLNPPYPPPELGQEAHGRYRVTRFQSEAELRAALIDLGDPSGNWKYFWIRSIVSCRSVTYGYDGQAFLCLRTEDTPPISSDPKLIYVEERSALLIETDYLDGAEAAADSL